MKGTFAIIGNNWGNKIYNILSELKFEVIKVNLKSPKNYKNEDAYLRNLRKQLNLIKKNYKIIWLAISPNKKKQFLIVKECLKKKFHLIIEKPWLVTKNKTEYLQKIQKKNNLLVGFHFEYLYLNFLKKNKFKFSNLTNNVILNFHVKNKNLKNNHKSELGSHLVAIKKYYFPRIKNCKISTGFKKNLRNISVKIKNKKIIHNFTYNTENIIQKFLKDYLNHYNKNKKFKLDFNFMISDKLIK
jgi:hypothetical protein